MDECGNVIPAGAMISFYVGDTVNADFTYQLHYGCVKDSIAFQHNGNNEVNSWQWTFDDISSNQQNPFMLFDPYGDKKVSLIVSNGFCSDTSDLLTIHLGTRLKADFEVEQQICPGEKASFKNTSTGDIVTWKWDFGNGNLSSLATPPPQIYQRPSITTTVHPRLLIVSNRGCTDVTAKEILLPDHCNVYVPVAFTPNQDGHNDYLYPLNIFNPTGFMFKVFNRYGQAVFSSTDLSKKWDGYYKGQLAEPGTYLWILHFTDTYTGNFVEQKGTVILLH